MLPRPAGRPPAQPRPLGCLTSGGPVTLAWLLADYYAQVVRESGSPLRLVYFMAPGLRQKFQADGTVPGPYTYDPDEPFRMRQCITEAEAVQWLLEQQVQEQQLIQ